MLMNDREEILTLQALQHQILIGGGSSGIAVIHEQRSDRRVERGIGERLAELHHVDARVLDVRQLGHPHRLPIERLLVHAIV